MTAARKNPSRNTSKNKAKKEPTTLHDIFITKLQSLYDVEKVITQALPKMAKHATDPELKAGFEKHLVETENHIVRLEQIFTKLDEKPKKLKVEAIRGMVADTEWVMKNVEKGEALDAALAGAAQYVEHYEIAGYGTAREWAEVMGHTEATRLLLETLDEEKKTDQTLNELAISRLNSLANDMRENANEE